MTKELPNIGSVLKEEIVRLSRRGSRLLIDPSKRTTTQLRHDGASLERQVAQLEHQLAMLARKVLGAKPSTLKVDPSARASRFSAKSLLARRSRVPLPAIDFGKLLEVGARSIYNRGRLGN